MRRRTREVGETGRLGRGRTGTAPMILAERITHGYGADPVLRDVTLSVERGEIAGLIGPNGSGKTTLLRTLYGSLSPDSGTVRFDGTDLTTISARRLARRVGVVAQEPAGDLTLSVAEVVLLGRTPHLGMFERQSRRDDALAAEALEQVGLLHLARRDFAGLSGGEKQRALIARALVQEAECLLLDEPTNHLDVGYQHQVLELVRGLGITAVVVLHDLNLAARYCDSLALLNGGRLIASGSPQSVLRREVLEPVYDIGVEPVRAADSTAQLLFSRSRE